MVRTNRSVVGILELFRSWCSALSMAFKSSVRNFCSSSGVSDVLISNVIMDTI